jgi:hypothetical protein
MSVNFPTSPALNDTYTYGGRSWIWSGAYWRATSTGSFGSISVSGNITLSGALLDNTGYTGSSGQVLTSTGTGIQWANSSSSSSSSAPIKTFNILGTFGLLTGTARFYPAAQDTIRSVILTVGVVGSQDLTVGLYRNNQFLQFFTVSAGSTYAKYSGLSYIIQTNESYTVNVVAGTGTNFSMALFDINL